MKSITLEAAPVNINNTETVERKKIGKVNLRNAGAIALAAGIGSGLYAGYVNDISNGASYSEETQQWTAQQGDGLLDAVNAVDGNETVDHRDVAAHIESMNHDALEDGLQAGEALTIPESVED